MRDSREALDDAVFMSDDTTLLPQVSLGSIESQFAMLEHSVVRRTFPVPRGEHRS